MNAAQAKAAWRDGLFAEFDQYVKKELHCVNNTVTQADIDLLIDFNYWYMNKPVTPVNVLVQEVSFGPDE
jgi:hypothetical protein